MPLRIKQWSSATKFDKFLLTWMNTKTSMCANFLTPSLFQAFPNRKIFGTKPFAWWIISSRCVDKFSGSYISSLVSRWHNLCAIFVFVQILESKGVTCDYCNLGYEDFPDGSKVPLPPVLIGHLGADPKKKTVCVYGHLHVQPALVEDGWNTDPFTSVEVDSKLYGRGATDDKGPVLAWINMIDACQKCSTPLPVNLKVSHFIH